MRACVAVLLVAMGAIAAAAPGPPRAVVPGVSTSPLVTTSCWIEPRWFETLRNGPTGYCKRSLRYRPGRVDCLAFIDEVCWALNQDTGEWTLLRNPTQETLVVCPEGPEPATCPRLH